MNVVISSFKNSFLGLKVEFDANSLTISSSFIIFVISLSNPLMITSNGDKSSFVSSPLLSYEAPGFNYYRQN